VTGLAAITNGVIGEDTFVNTKHTDQVAAEGPRAESRGKSALEQARPVLAKLPLLGPIGWLFAHHPAKRYLFLGDIDWAVMPPLVLDQCKLYMQGEAPFAYLSWAFVNDEVQARLAGGQLRLAPHEWKCGENLWLIDVVAPFGKVDDLIRELREKVFPTRPIKCLAPDPEGKGLRVTEWPAIASSQ